MPKVIDGFGFAVLADFGIASASDFGITGIGGFEPSAVDYLGIISVGDWSF